MKCELGEGVRRGACRADSTAAGWTSRFGLAMVEREGLENRTESLCACVSKGVDREVGSGGEWLDGPGTGASESSAQSREEIAKRREAMVNLDIDAVLLKDTVYTVVRRTRWWEFRAELGPRKGRHTHNHPCSSVQAAAQASTPHHGVLTAACNIVRF